MHLSIVKPTYVLKSFIRLLVALCLPILTCAYTIPVPIKLKSMDPLELINLSAIDARVQAGVTLRNWQDWKTIPGWTARNSDQSTTHFQLTHGRNPASGIQVFVDPSTHLAVAIGSLTDGSNRNALIAVAVENATGKTINSLTLRLEQIQWFAGTIGMSDWRYASWGISESLEMPHNWNNEERLDLRNFVSDNGGLAVPLRLERNVELENINWQTGQILWLRWVDMRVSGGGNAGAGLASLKIQAL